MTEKPVVVGTTQRYHDFPNPVKTISIYNDSTNTLYYNLRQNQKGIATTNDRTIPPKTSRYIGKDETLDKRIMFINLICDAGSNNIYIEHTTYAGGKTV